MLPEKVKSLIGRTGEPVIYEVEKGAIKKYADAIGDKNLLHWDEDYAKNSKYGTIIAPPGFFGWPAKWEGMPIYPKIRYEIIDTLKEAGYSRILDGGIEYEFFLPVRAGDVLVSVLSVADIYEREGKGSALVFTILETKYFSLDGNLVAKARQTIITR